MPEEMIEEAEQHIRLAWGAPIHEGTTTAAYVDRLIAQGLVTGNDVIALVASALNREDA